MAHLIDVRYNYICIRTYVYEDNSFNKLNVIDMLLFYSCESLIVSFYTSKELICGVFKNSFKLNKKFYNFS